MPVHVFLKLLTKEMTAYFAIKKKTDLESGLANTIIYTDSI